MRNKIACPENSTITISGIDGIFTLIKHYIPETAKERYLCENSAFIQQLTQKEGIYIYENKSIKIFAFRFTPGRDPFPFINEIDNVYYTSEYLVLCFDKEKDAFFKYIP